MLANLALILPVINFFIVLIPAIPSLESTPWPRMLAGIIALFSSIIMFLLLPFSFGHFVGSSILLVLGVLEIRFFFVLIKQNSIPMTMATITKEES